MRHRRFAIILLLLVVGMAGYCYFHVMEVTSVRDNGAGADPPSDWNQVLAKANGGSAPALEIDGIAAEEAYRPWLDSAGQVMLPEDALTERLGCAVSVYEENRILVEWGERSLEAYLDSDLIRVGGEETVWAGVFQRHQEQYYVSAQAISQAFPFTYTWDTRENKVSMTSGGGTLGQEGEESPLPAAYDYRERERAPQILDQGDLGTCWAFASLTALESALTPEERLVCSRDHMSLNNGFGRGQMDGGDYTMAMSYLLAWQGPVLEADDPYGDGETTPDLQPVKHVQEIQMLPKKDLERIKEAVFLYGGVHTPLYFALADNEVTDEEAGQYYRRDTASYCYIGTNKINHDVVIVGWDDQYSKSNFPMEPEGDGAFLCMNSWGEGFGDHGYFWISYYDTNIGIYNICYTGVEDTDNYDAIYQSDLGGFVGQVGYKDETAYFANVYTAEADETLSAAGFYAVGPDTSYEIYAVPRFEGTKSLDFSRQVAAGTVENAGYYTIPFEEQIALTAGQQFAIIVYIRTPGEERPIAIEYAEPGTDLENLDMSDGQGYISFKGLDWQSAEEEQGCNICLKAYTKK